MPDETPETPTDRPATYTGFVDPPTTTPTPDPTPASSTSDATTSDSGAGDELKEIVAEEVKTQIAASKPLRASLMDRGADTDPILGQHVDVVSGDYQGRYGVWVEAHADQAVVVTADNDNLRLSTAITDLRPAQAGRR